MNITGKVLVVDDEPAVRHTLARILQGAGMEVTTAEDGPQGLALLEAGHFDLVFTDIRMPGMAGLDLLQLIHARYPRLAVVIFTAQPDVHSAVQALRRGATDYLIKPLNPQAVIERTQSILMNQHKERRRREIQAQLDSLQGELNQLDKPAEAAQLSAPLPPTSERYFQRGVLVLDRYTHRVTIGDLSTELLPTTFEMLLALAHHAPQVVDYQTLVAEAQGYQVDAHEAQDLVKWHIHHIRQAIEVDARHPRRLFNVRGVGYRLVTD